MAEPRVPRDFKPYVEAAKAKGWTLSHTRNGHLRLMSPPGAAQAIVVLPSSPGDHRAVRNFRGDLRRAGVDC